MPSARLSPQSSQMPCSINANENPLGPCDAAREAIAAITPQSGRYLWSLTGELINAVRAECRRHRRARPRSTPGSTEPLTLHRARLLFAARQLRYRRSRLRRRAVCRRTRGARVVKVPLTKTYAHDVKAMLAAAPDAGVFYICKPNNPTGTLTSLADIEYLVENKPKNSIVLVDEAYIHFSDAPSAIELVKAGKDVIVLRTFSKIYGMAGLRCGFAIGRPDLLEKLQQLRRIQFHARYRCRGGRLGSLKDAQSGR